MLLKDKIKEVTADTNGVLLYQEQVIKIIMSLGYSKEEAYALMKKIGKKKDGAIEEFKTKILEVYGEESLVDMPKFLTNMGCTVCKTYYNTFEIGLNAFLDAITHDEKIDYKYQMYVIVKVILGEDWMKAIPVGNDSEVEKIISSINNKYKEIMPNLCQRVEKILKNSNISSLSPQLIE